MSLYDIKKSYLENAEEGPFFTSSYPERADSTISYNFLGFPVRSRIGVFAGPLLNSRWVSCASQLGFDILTYKTIRSHEHPGHPLPNILFVNKPKQLSINNLPQSLRVSEETPSYESLGITNSFGMPSRNREYLEKDIPLANSAVKKGQVLIISITGTPPLSGNKSEYIEDMVESAVFAKNCGARIIEANFSCPNVSQAEGSLYLDPDGCYEAALQITKALGSTPLIIKVGCYPDPAIQTQVFLALAESGVRAISGINTISMKVVDEKNQSALGDSRPVSGICGYPIREAALDFVRNGRKIIDRENLDLTLIGGGGILLPEHFDHVLEAGADFAFTATGMMWNPLLASQYHHLKEYEYADK